MTEAEWLACTDPRPMLDFLRGKTSDRKLRLFGAACCRHIWHLLPDDRCRRAVEVAEQYADSQAGRAELETAHHRAYQATRSARRQARAGQNPASYQAARAAVAVATRTTVRETAAEAALAVETAMAWDTRMERTPGMFQGIFGPRAAIQAAWEDELRHQSLLLRDVFGVPFRPSVVGPGLLAWKDRTIPQLGQAIYDQRTFHDLPILADALEEAGCTQADLLNHCRQPGEHVRGCWAVDLVVGRS